MRDTVLVTGGSGYVAGWCIVELLRRGYAVRTTVRNLAKADAVRAAVASAEEPGDGLEVVAADLMDDAGWDAAMQGVRFVLHVASPMGNGAARTADELVKPAREGALRVLAAADRSGVKRVVMTSSCAAATPRNEAMGADTVSDETVWGDPEAQAKDFYRLSKTLAERAAWDFMKERKTELVAVLPSAIFGPVLSIEGLGSVRFIQRLFDGSTPRVPRVGLNIIDVRDLAVAHVLAMTIPEAAGQRYIINGDFLWMMEVAKMLRAGLGEAGSKVPVKPLPDFVVTLGAPVSPALKTLKPLIGRGHRFSSAKARRELGLVTRPAEETVLDCAHGLIAGGAPT
jgi:dihydroflavonol-4-reductase